MDKSNVHIRTHATWGKENKFQVCLSLPPWLTSPLLEAWGWGLWGSGASGLRGLEPLFPFNILQMIRGVRYDFYRRPAVTVLHVVSSVVIDTATMLSLMLLLQLGFGSVLRLVLSSSDNSSGPMRLKINSRCLPDGWMDPQYTRTISYQCGSLNQPPMIIDYLWLQAITITQQISQLEVVVLRLK